MPKLFTIKATLTLNNRRFIIPTVGEIGLPNIYLSGDWFLEMLKQLRIPEGASFIDVGVNIGQTLLAFRSCYDSPYWGFEPNPHCVFYLDLLVESNRFSNVHILPIGLSSTNQLARFYKNKKSDTAATIVDDVRTNYYDPAAVQLVPVFAFDQLAIDNVGKIAVIKIDVEGGELEVILGLTETIRKHGPLIICEVLDYHAEDTKAFVQARADQLVQHLRELHYRIFRIIHLDPSQIRLQEVERVVLVSWRPESMDLNDYLLVPDKIQPPLPVI